MPGAGSSVRPIIQRDTVRVLLIDPAERILLFEDSDPGLPSRPTFWITPGGGVDPGETLAEAVIREVAEETGFTLAAKLLRGPVARRNVVHGYSDKIVQQRETYVAAHVPSFVIDTVGHTDDEVASVVGHRWWSLAELTTANVVVWPAGLAGLVKAVLDAAPWPVPLDDAEESTVPPDSAPARPSRCHRNSYQH